MDAQISLPQRKAAEGFCPVTGGQSGDLFRTRAAVPKKAQDKAPRSGDGLRLGLDDKPLGDGEHARGDEAAPTPLFDLDHAEPTASLGR
jgi:hypothetical protein